MAEERTIQSNIKNHENDDLLNYALFVGGLNVILDTVDCLWYSPRSGYRKQFRRS